MASEETLARSGGVREGYPGSSVTPPPSGLVARRDQCAERTALAPSSARSSTVYRRLKRRLGRSLRGLHCKRRLVIHGKSPSYKLSGTEGSPPGSPNSLSICARIRLCLLQRTTQQWYHT